MSDLHGWTGKILRVNLTTSSITTTETSNYVPKFIGGMGIAYRIAWEEIPRGVGCFDPKNLLMVMTGPLTGTLAPTSGRTQIAGIAPQSYPEMFSWSGVGGWFGAKLKYAGFDGIIIEGKSSKPCYLWIEDEKVEIKEAGVLWGMGARDVQIELRRIHGKDVCSLAIGPAGENLSRIAVILTDNTNAAGQGGFGGVAGSKNLKAICVRGTKPIKIADPSRLLQIRKEISPKPSKNPIKTGAPLHADGIIVEQALPYQQFDVACSHACNTRCMQAHKDAPRATRPGLVTQSVTCIGPFVFEWPQSGGWGGLEPVKWPLWSASYKRGIEASELINQYGLNEWEILGGMVPWLVMAAHEGVLTEEQYGGPINPSEDEWWPKFLHMLAYREGFGDLLSEGTTRAINVLGREKYGNTIYTGERSRNGAQRPTPISIQEAWGYAGHWSGRGIHSTLPFPDWLLRALTWMTSTRDSNDSTHHKDLPEWYEEFIEDPYRGKIGPWMAIWDENKSELKNSLTLCDWAFPIPGRPSVEAELFSAVTGIETSEETLDKAGERLKNQIRALIIRNYDRNRQQEFNEIMPFFKIPDHASIPIDEKEFAIMVDNYYEQRGWDQTTGWPKRSTLESLELNDVADELENLGKLP